MELSKWACSSPGERFFSRSFRDLNGPRNRNISLASVPCHCTIEETLAYLMAGKRNGLLLARDDSPFRSAGHPMPSPLHVLVVDDDADNADTTAVMLRIWGYEATIAR